MHILFLALHCCSFGKCFSKEQCAPRCAARALFVPYSTSMSVVKGTLVRHFGVNTDGEYACDGRALSADGKNMYLACSGSIMTFVVPNKGGKVSEADPHREMDMRSSAIMSIAKCVAKSSLFVVLVPESTASEDDESLEPIDYRIKEFAADGAFKGKFTACKRPFSGYALLACAEVAFPGVAAPVTVVYLSVSDSGSASAGSTLFVFNRKGKRLAEWRVPFCASHLDAFHGSGNLAMASTNGQLFVYTASGDQLAAAPSAHLEDMCVSPAGNIIWATHLGIVHAYSAELEPQTQWAAQLAPEDRLVPSDDDDSDYESSSNALDSEEEQEDSETEDADMAASSGGGGTKDDAATETTTLTEEETATDVTPVADTSDAGTANTGEAANAALCSGVTHVFCDGTYVYVRLESNDVLVFE